MTLTQLLFSFKGRINRKPWWVASLAAGFAASLLTAILEVVARSAGETIVNPVTHHSSRPVSSASPSHSLRLVNAWIAFALSVKRLHDRDRTGWWLLWQILDHRRRRDPDHGRHHGAEGTRAAVVCARGRRWPRGLRHLGMAVHRRSASCRGRKGRTASARTRSVPLGTTRSSRPAIELSLPPRQAAIQIGEKQGAPP